MWLFIKKAVLYVLMAALFGACYQTVADLTMERSRHLSFLTWLDERIPFIPAFVLPYMSLYIFFWLPPIFVKKVAYKDFLIMAKATALTFLISFTIYLIVPSAYPRPKVNADNSIILSLLANFLYQYDSPNNTLPSTHAAVVTILLLAMREKLSRASYVIYALWGMSILISTLTLKQHFITDIISGMILGATSLYLAKRMSRTKTKSPPSS